MMTMRGNLAIAAAMVLTVTSPSFFPPSTPGPALDRVEYARWRPLITVLKSEALRQRCPSPGVVCASAPAWLDRCLAEENAMSEILQDLGICTQITTVKLDPRNQEEVINLMIERAPYMAKQKGFVSVNLHRSKDGSHVINYVQWTSQERLAAAHHSPEFHNKWPRFDEIVKEIEPCLYEVVHVETA